MKKNVLSKFRFTTDIVKLSNEGKQSFNLL